MLDFDKLTNLVKEYGWLEEYTTMSHISGVYQNSDIRLKVKPSDYAESDHALLRQDLYLQCECVIELLASHGIKIFSVEIDIRDNSYVECSLKLEVKDH